MGLQEFFVEIPYFCHTLKELFVVKRYSKLRCQKLTYLSAAATKFSSYGYDPLFHNEPPFRAIYLSLLYHDSVIIAKNL